MQQGYIPSVFLCHPPPSSPPGYSLSILPTFRHLLSSLSFGLSPALLQVVFKSFALQGSKFWIVTCPPSSHSPFSKYFIIVIGGWRGGIVRTLVHLTSSYICLSHWEFGEGGIVRTLVRLTSSSICFGHWEFGEGGIVRTLVRLTSSSICFGHWEFGEGGVVRTLCPHWCAYTPPHWELGGGIVSTLVRLYSSIYLDHWGLGGGIASTQISHLIKGGVKSWRENKISHTITSIQKVVFHVFVFTVGGTRPLWRGLLHTGLIYAVIKAA
ncbi:hypothetical protein F4604DRAFT_1684864 [Suillus subluteus]|nr:hypothetical protein F4604DRAFT_1684864 [Suillus subluteus]